ncbi:unnamed protein product, partial [Amoebophrya sp. A25]|eukprot:GSA25T00018202001.1
MQRSEEVAHVQTDAPASSTTFHPQSRVVEVQPLQGGHKKNVDEELPQQHIKRTPEELPQLKLLQEEELWRAHIPMISWVCTPLGVESMVAVLERKGIIGVDVEGVQLGKDGSVCLLQIMAELEVG